MQNVRKTIDQLFFKQSLMKLNDTIFWHYFGENSEFLYTCTTFKEIHVTVIDEYDIFICRIVKW